MEEIRKIIREIFEEQMKAQRYVAKIDFYVYANSDEEAMAKSKSIADEMEMRTANQAKVVELGKQSFGTLGYTPVSIKE